MKLLIIQPSHYRGRSNRRLYKSKRRSLVGLTLPYLAALTPSDWEVELIDQQLSDIDFKARVDLVAITTWTINSLAAYEIAGRFRARGVAVIMGGPHTYFFSDEAAGHCDAVGIGEGEDIWPRMLEDAANGRLRKFYRAQGYQNLEALPLPRHELLDLRRYGPVKTFSVQTSRGCPFRCDFCSERFYLGKLYRYRPVRDVIDEIKAIKGKYFFFADSTFAGKKSHAAELMEALAPLGIHWSTLWSSNLCRNEKFMDLAKRSGLLHVNIGIESIDQATLSGMNKKANKVRYYEEILNNLRKRGISYSLNFVFGYDSEDKSIYECTLAFLRRNKVPVAYFNILTPHIGTPLYERMKAENRLIDSDNIGRWPGITCYFLPQQYSPEQLEKNVKRLYRQFYSARSIVSRLPFPRSRSDAASWMANLTQRNTSRANDTMENFDTY